MFNGIGPNPFTPGTDSGGGGARRAYFYYANPEQKETTLRIFDLSGTLIREISIAEGVTPYWDGRNQDGVIVEGGMYIYQLKVGNEVVKGTIVLAK